MSQRKKEIRKMVYEQSKNIIKEIEIIKKSQTQLLELKGKMTEYKNSLAGLKIRSKQKESGQLNFNCQIGQLKFLSMKQK